MVYMTQYSDYTKSCSDSFDLNMLEDRKSTIKIKRNNAEVKKRFLLGVLLREMHSSEKLLPIKKCMLEVRGCLYC